uniref:RING-type domain-containing protein n=1 Tax=Kalanchoe fedtschenkoi TaxID=63787 RepID=A0A7N0VIE7_KALFE
MFALLIILRAVFMWLITAVFFLFLTLLAIFFVHLFSLGRHLQLHRRRRQLHVSTPSYSSCGGRVSKEDLLGLPGFRFSKGSHQLDPGISECVICLDRIREGELCRILPGCTHVFHLECVDAWLVKATPACPICRARVICPG